MAADTLAASVVMLGSAVVMRVAAVFRREFILVLGHRAASVILHRWHSAAFRIGVYRIDPSGMMDSAVPVSALLDSATTASGFGAAEGISILGRGADTTIPTGGGIRARRRMTMTTTRT